MEFLGEFFRTKADGYVFDSYSAVHVSILLVLMIAIILLVKFKEVLWENTKVNKYIKYTIVVTLAAQQSIMYLWYFIGDYKIVHEGLPLYNCRIAIISVIIGLLFNKRFFKYIAVYWGSFGTVLALLMPELDPFSFPHYTGISYFVGHGFLAIAVAYLVIIDNLDFNNSDLRNNLIFTTLYHLLIWIFNYKVGSNYCYLNYSPINFGSNLPYNIYIPSAIILFNLTVGGIHIIGKRLKAARDLNYSEIELFS